MKKAIGLLMIVAVMMLVFVGGVVFAVLPDSPACTHSQAIDPAGHASAVGVSHASDNSVLKSCDGGGTD